MVFFDYENIAKKAKAYARRQGRDDIADDFSQEVICYCLEKNIEHINIRYRYLNYIEQIEGTPNSVRQEGLKKTSEYDEEKHTQKSKSDQVTWRNTIISLFAKPDEAFIFDLIEYGYTRQQISFLCNISESRLWQKIQELKQRIKNYV